MTRFVCLVHYHELGLKGRNRSVFERKLRANIAHALREIAPLSKVSKLAGRERVTADSFEQAQEIAQRVSLIPGVVRVSCALQCERELEIMCETALAALELAEPYETFKVDARRANTNFPISSMELNQLVGAWLCEKLPQKRVQMRDMDAKVHVEVIENNVYVYVHSIRGVGGLPVGSSGRVVCLLSAGLDSPVAAWRMMRRGARVTGLHFSGAPEVPDTSSYLVGELAQVLSPAGGLDRLICVPFGSYQREISLNVPDKLRVIFYRRLMVAVANVVAKREKAGALVTGESLGQVASQTLANIRAVDEVATLPILRPLIGTDKQEIIDEALRLGTYELSTQDHDDCCTLFMPRNPETHAKLDEVAAAWETLPIQQWVSEITSELVVRAVGQDVE
ncbi:MAG: tRNA 4-thiouridine(8) synthase ThiI [Coriobacteriia bacterium]|jgi:thiamine biosynthesis protein ThiI|nr:tRNA 4-thiouridine(8) synthase ThiI [Coriobacteriia bacterium]MDR2714154.1 tRNA 4-thiouridine(8) synthase ThiI [Coriobacteriales bacterium]